MLPHSYTLDSQSKAQDLASLILSASSPPQISSACASILSFLHHLSPDQSRWFFSLAFPALIAKLFGFDHSSPPPQQTSSLSSSSKPLSLNGWIDTVCTANDPDLSGKLFSLLSPDSLLLSLISAVDRLSLVKFVFPIERLPEWTRYMLSNQHNLRVLSDLCLLFKNRVTENQVQLNVYEYYMFWFAYYPVCKGNNGNSVNLSVQKSKMFRLEKWASSIKGFSSVKCESKQKSECNFYVRLLYAYLRAFVPISDLNAHSPYRSSLLHYQSDYDSSVLMRAEFVVNTLIQFWLVDNDFSPVPVSVSKSFGVSFPFQTVLGETPPVSGLGEIVNLLVKYLNLSASEVTEGSNEVDYCESPRWKSMGSCSFDVKSPYIRSVGSWNSMIQRPLYRYILRTFLFCPIETSMKNVSEIFTLWITFIEPWKFSSEDFAELDSIVFRAKKDERKIDAKSVGLNCLSSWQEYVLSNYLFYSSLVMHFIGFAHKFLHADAEVIVEMVVKVISILTSFKELTELIKNVDSVFHSKQVAVKSNLHSLYRYIPSIREQLQDWENGLCESDADGSFLHENWNKDFCLFSDGGQQILELFILRAESEFHQATCGDNLANNNLQSLKCQVNYLFGGQTVKRLSFSSESTTTLVESRDEMFTPRRVGNKYKGDYIKRPISNDEIAWLAKLLVHFSIWINQKLGLNQDSNHVEVVSTTDNYYSGNVKTIIYWIGSWISTILLGEMRKHGMRVNLRVLASKKVVMVVLLLAIFRFIKKAILG